MIETFSYLLPLSVPIYYNLSFQYYLGFCFFILSNYMIKERNDRFYKLFQYECFIFLNSLYICHNMIWSYFMVAFLLLGYEWSNGIFIRLSLFIFTYIMNQYKNPFLFYPFIYLIIVLPSYLTGNIIIFRKTDMIQYNIIQTIFFLLCYQSLSIKNIDHHEM